MKSICISLMIGSVLICAGSAWSAANSSFVKPGDYRQTVALVDQQDPGKPGYVFCSGTLIGPHTVLSAAHCLDHEHIAVYVGDGLDPSVLPMVFPNFAVKEVKVHPQYDPDVWGSNFTPRNDFMLLTLERDVDLKVFGINPAPMSNISFVSLGRSVTAVGYGVLKTGGKKGQKTYFTLPVANLTLYEFSVGSPWRRGPGTCHGDSGGSAYARGDDNKLYFVGVPTYILGDESCIAASSHFQTITPDVLEWVRSEQSPLFE